MHGGNKVIKRSVHLLRDVPRVGSRASRKVTGMHRKKKKRNVSTKSWPVSEEIAKIYQIYQIYHRQIFSGGKDIEWGIIKKIIILNKSLVFHAILSIHRMCFNLKPILNLKTKLPNYTWSPPVYPDRLVFRLMKHLKTEPLYYTFHAHLRSKDCHNVR